MDVKPFPPLLPLEVTDFTSWCLKINGEDDGQRAPVEKVKVTDAAVFGSCMVHGRAVAQRAPGTESHVVLRLPTP